MERIFILLFSLICSASSYARAKYDCVYTSVPNLKVVNIERTSDETVIDFTYAAKSGDQIQLDTTTFICDKSGNHFKVLSSEMLHFKSKKAGENGEVRFRMHFGPLPNSPEWIDIFGILHKKKATIYGVHSPQKNIRIPIPETFSAVNEIGVNDYQPGSAMIIGHLAGKKIEKGTRIELQHFTNIENDSQKASWINDSTFKFRLYLQHALWDNILIGNQYLQFFVRPNDTLNIFIKNYNVNGETIRYSSASGQYCLDSLLCHGDHIEGSTHLDKLPSQEFERELNKLREQSTQLCQYIAWKYHFSPLEYQFLINQQRLQLAYRYMFYYGSSDIQFTSQSPFLHDIPWHDPSLLFIRGWNDNFVALLCLKMLNAYRYQNDISDDDLNEVFPNISDVIKSELKRVLFNRN